MGTVLGVSEVAHVTQPRGAGMDLPRYCGPASGARCLPLPGRVRVVGVPGWSAFAAGSPGPVDCGFMRSIQARRAVRRGSGRWAVVELLGEGTGTRRRMRWLPPAGPFGEPVGVPDAPGEVVFVPCRPSAPAGAGPEHGASA